MTSRRLVTVITLPWLAAALVLLLVVKLRDERGRWHWGLFGSAAICFSIGCLARTSVMLADQKRPSGDSGGR
jgi:hypothetical protein